MPTPSPVAWSYRHPFVWAFRVAVIVGVSYGWIKLTVVLQAYGFSHNMLEFLSTPIVLAIFAAGLTVYPAVASLFGKR